MKLRVLSYWVGLTCIFACGAGAQVNVFDVPVGARNTSLANANIAESRDISVMYESPAPLAFLEHGTLLLNHSQGIGTQGMQENLALPVILQNSVVIALGLDVYHQGSPDRAGQQTQSILDYGYDIALAGRITPSLSIGGSAALHRGILSGVSQAWGSHFMVGVDYAPTPDFSYSAVYKGTGREFSYGLTDSATFIQNSIMERRLEVGATMTYPSAASLRPPLFILSFANEKIFGVKGLYYKGGMEIRMLGFLGLRFGYMAGPGVNSARYGLGFLGKVFSLNYAVCPQPDSHNLLQQVTASVGF